MPLNTKIVMPMALGLSLVTVTALVVYYVFKKDEQDEKGEKTVKSSRANTIEIPVPKAIVPALIGRGGSNIKEIEKKSGAGIHFKKFTDKEYDVCIIRGKSDATQLAETLIHDFIQNQPLIEEDSLLVPAWACGRIIGKEGENINDISHRSGARVKVENGSTDKATERKVTIRGSKQQIAVAKDLIENCVSQEKCRREIESSRRSPRVSTPQPPQSPQTPQASPGDRHVRYKRPDTVGAPIEVYVSAVSSPSRFWVQFVGPQVAQLDELVAHMTEYYGNKDNRAQHAVSSVSVGQVVAAVFRHDGRWYRARVHDIRPNEFDASQQVADVFYLDYGDSEYVATHELCELRADLLRLRFQAMECFLAGVVPAGPDTEQVTPSGQRWQRWHPQAVERFEELTQVARWKPLVSRTCSYKKIASVDGDKDKEVPGIKLFDVTDEGELDIGAALIAEGWAVEGSQSPRASPPRNNHQPFGDLGNSKVLSMFGSPRASSLPKDHKDDGTETHNGDEHNDKENDRMTSSQSLSAGLEASDKVQISNFDLTLSDKSLQKPNQNGSHDFIYQERMERERDASAETLTPTDTPTKLREEFKANINRIDSHHGNLEALGISQYDLSKTQ